MDLVLGSLVYLKTSRAGVSRLPESDVGGCPVEAVGVVVQVEALALGRVVVAVRLLIAIQRVAATVLQGRAELANRKTSFRLHHPTEQQL